MEVDLHWSAPPYPPSLIPGQVHVWWASCVLPPPGLARSQSWLSPDEQQRAARFAFERDRQRYIAGRGLLRQILGVYLQQDPATLSFCYGPYGKPSLAHGPQDLYFNLSHSADWALYAIASIPVGIDLEALRPVPQMDGIVKRYFSELEQQTFRALPEALQPTTFFRAWTCKEAYLKAIGQGLTLPLSQIDVELDPQKTIHYRHLPEEKLGRDWQLWSFQPAPDLWAAVTVPQDPDTPPQLFYGGWVQGDWLGTIPV